METYLTTDLPYLIFSVKERFFAISAGFIQEMLAVPAITHLPDAPPYVRGVINIRGKVYKLIDMRMRLGMKSHKQENEELIESLSEREKEHKNWLNELENCIKEDREFTLGVDPHKCKFGQWYDNFKTDNPAVSLELNKFDEPHRAIHETAEHVIELAHQGKKDEALAVIDERRNGELATMMNLFESMKKMFREAHREIAVILELDEDAFALAVDRLESVEDIDIEEKKEQSAEVLEGIGGNFHGHIARRKESDQLLLLVDPYWLAGSELSKA